MKCTYKKCDGAEINAQGLAGIVDERMRPWHLHCARKALTEFTWRTTLDTVCVLTANLLILLYIIHRC